jgi:uncharacterized Zn finger protein (UPF0148 family)
MSEFDKEKERERLREQYERDRKKREATEQMSELLLQGATMTNAHCSECGDPIFRYDGQEFCATCERPVERAADASEDGDEDEDDQLEVTTPSEDTRVVFGDESDQAAQQKAQTGTRQAEGGEGPLSRRDTAGGADDPTTRATADRSTSRADDPTTRATADRSTPRADDSTARATADRQSGRTSAGEQVERRDTYDSGGGLDAARDSLVRTLVAHADRAEAAGDPREARDHLQVAREAAETLDALR